MPDHPRLHLTLVDHASAVADALATAVGAASLDGVEVVCGSLFDVRADAIVSPGNSFGFMDGGVDLECVLRYGLAVQDRVRAAIRDRFDGELLVGQAVLVPTGDAAHPRLVAAPTMRVPMRLPSHTPNPYLAMRAVLLVCRHRTAVRRVAVPGLGTGVGRVPPTLAARQMVEAIRHVRDGHPRDLATWEVAVDQHRRMTAGHG